MKLRSIKNRRDPLPVGVCLDSMRDALEGTRSGQVVLGEGQVGDGLIEGYVRPELLDLDDSHVLIVAGTGAGKTVLMRSILAQVLADGAEVVIVDRTRSAHRWAVGHPDVTQVWALDEIADELVRLGEELERRQAVAESDILTARRLVLGIEDRAGLSVALQERWFELRSTGDPKKSPAVEALSALEWASPMLGIHVVATTNSGAWMPAMTAAPYRVRLVSSRVGETAWPIFANGMSRRLSAASAGRRGLFYLVQGATQRPLVALHLTAVEAQHLVAALIASGRGSWGAA